jgi:hypothetical protein
VATVRQVWRVRGGLIIGLCGGVGAGSDVELVDGADEGTAGVVLCVSQTRITPSLLPAASVARRSPRAGHDRTGPELEIVLGWHSSWQAVSRADTGP